MCVHAYEYMQVLKMQPVKSNSFSCECTCMQLVSVNNCFTLLDTQENNGMSMAHWSDKRVK